MNLLHANDALGRYPQSYYAASAHHLAPFGRLEGEHKAQVCVIGGGYTGLSAALHLARMGMDVTVLEAQRVGFGASGRNGGQLGSGQRQDQDWLEAHFGHDTAHQLWALSEAAKTLVHDLIAAYKMPVDYRPGIAHVYRRKHAVVHAHRAAERLARNYGYDAVNLLDQTALRAIVKSNRYVGGTIDYGAGHLHPLNFALGLAKAAHGLGAQIYEQSEVIKITQGQKVVVQTASGHITCDHVILACNGYLGGLMPQVAARVMPINNFIVATAPLGPQAKDILAAPIAVADSDFVVNYWRMSADNRLLFGGGESYAYRFPHDLRKVVSKPMLKVYPQLKDVPLNYAWGGTLAITMNRMPYFARIGPNILSASGYSGHGLGMATLAGKIMAEAILGQAGKFDILAALPQSRFPGGGYLRSPLLALAMAWYMLRDRLA